MKLPIYLGANDATMSYGAAHLTYTSLPRGQKYNTVLTGHTDISAEFSLITYATCKSVMSKTAHLRDNLTYKVVETKICKPNESQDIFIKKTGTC